MYRVKLVKISIKNNYSGYGDYYDNNETFIMAIPEFSVRELNEDDYYELQEAVDYFNKRSDTYKIFMLEEVSDLEVNEVLNDHKAYMEKERLRKEKLKLAQEKANKEKKEKALERKRKQLKKLIDEIGDVNG